jgi:prepilin-type processing-associated H-X9-DG protein
MDGEHGEIKAWVESMRAQGYTAEEIRAQLAQSGWAPAEIESLLGGTAVLSAVPPPTPAAQPPPPVAQPPAPGYAQAPYYVPPQQVATQTDGLALASLILGCTGLLTGGLTSLVGLPLGIVALKRGGTGRGMALAGVIISGVMVLLFLALVGICIAGAYHSFQPGGPPHHTATTRSSTNSLPEAPAQPGANEIQPEAPGAALGNGLITPNTASGTAGRKGNQKVCFTRIQELAQGMLMYAADYDTALPDSANWPQAIQPYVKDDQGYFCPSDDRADKQEAGGRTTSYTMYDPMGGTYLRDENAKGKAYLLFDGTAVSADENGGALRHNGGLNLAYADGHAQWVTEKEFKNPN